MWKPIAISLDRLVAWHIRRRLISKTTHRTDPAALRKLVGEIDGKRPADLFPPPPPLDEAEVVLERDVPIGGGDHWMIRMPSAHPNGVAENRTIWLRVLLPPRCGWRVPCVIMVHPWIGPGGRTHLRKHGRRFLRQGIGSVTITLPHHFQRAAPGSWSGELSVCGDLVAVVEAAIQGMSDMRRAVAWLRSRGIPRLGMMGFSLGGGMAAMMATVDPELVCVAAMAPVASAGPCLLGSALTEGTIQDDLEASGLDDGLFDRACRLLSPAAHEALLPGDRLLVVGSRHDAILPPDCFSDLAQRWRCEHWDEPHGHITLFLTRGPGRRVVQWVLERLSG